MRPILTLCVLAGAIGCGDSLQVEGVSASGRVGGIVVDAETRQPLAGADVTLLAGSKDFGPKTTDETGVFAFGSVPAGEILVTIAGPVDESQPVYNNVWINEELPAATGEFPSGNVSLTMGPIGLVPLTRSFAIRVLDALGAPVVNYPVTIQTFPQWVDLSTGVGDGVGEIVLTQTTDVSGYAVYGNFPDHFALGPQVSDAGIVLLPPYDADGDGVLEFAGGDRLLLFRDLADPTPDVVLDAGFTVQLEVRASTVTSLSAGAEIDPAAAVVAIDDPVFVTFNLPVQDTVEVSLYDEDGAIVGLPTLEVSDDTLRIPFNQSPLLPSSELNIHVHAVARVGNRLLTGDFAGNFFTRPLQDEVTVTATRDNATQLVTLEFSEPIGIGAPGLQSVLDAPNCVLFYAHDLNNSGTIGDAPGEIGNPSCVDTLQSVEPEVPGPATLSGYSSRWTFVAPSPVLPATTPVHLLFSSVPDSSKVVQRADGRAVADLTGVTAISLP